MMRKLWNVRPSNRLLEDKLVDELKITRVVARILINRRITDPDDVRGFLNGGLPDLFDPFLLKDMERAVSRIREAMDKREKVLIYGDYDVDGITSVALLKKVLDGLGADSITYIPNRLEEGYGLNSEAVADANRKDVKLIITADCGSDALDEVRVANSLGIDVIITDHHEIKSDKIPPAYAIINPHQSDCSYPFKYLAGVGIVYKLAQALTRKKFCNLEQHLDLVALGTVADVAPQISENRIFTKCGMRALSRTEHAGLGALISVSGLKDKEISVGHIGYILGPRINAMGRTGSPDVALKLLLTGNRLEADNIAGLLNKENKTRQKIESRILEQALSRIEKEVNFKEHLILVVAQEGWHSGVIGIVASRIQERFYRPTVMIALEGDTGKGSGRSIENFNLFAALKHSSEHLTDFGGHESACGLSIHRDKVDAFRDSINAYARGCISDTDLLPKINIDMEIPFADLTEGLVKDLDLLSPYGPGNPRPVFVSSQVAVKDRPRLLGKNGYKMWLESGN
ncbi:MAG: single-stranded-DNA-specific exonuclease RecJ, partial [Candidatus Omnitrophota bacterium]